MSSDSASRDTRRTVRIGKYEVIEHIASGGMGAVYKAFDVELHREVALKILPPDMAANATVLERFRREARNAAKLRHENIVAIYEFGEHTGTWFLALEFVDGVDLHEYISRKGKLEPDEARYITFQAALALDHAHKQGIVHRDIKPSNFLITRKNKKLLVKLTDMGLARKADDREFRVTRAGTTVGTVDYMSPEQGRDSASADIRSDIYSLGCTLFHMLAGNPPFPDGSLTERLYKHIETEPPSIRDINAKVTPAMAAVLKRMLAKKPQDRFQTPAALLKALVRPQEEVASPSDSDLTDRDVLAGLAWSADESGPQLSALRADSPTRPAGAPRPRRRSASETREASSSKTQPMEASRPWLWIVGGVSALLVLAALASLWLVVHLRTPSPNDKPTAAGPTPPAEQAPPPETHESVRTPRPIDSSNRDPETKPTPDPRLPTNVPDPKPAGETETWPLLFAHTPPINREKLWRQFHEPWASENTPPAGTSVLHVCRLKRGLATKTDFDSLAAACAAAPADRQTIIEIDDNGPLFESSITLSKRRLIVRPGAGYRPLIVWNAAGSGGKPATFITASQGGLTLENLDVAVKWNDAATLERAYLFRVIDGDWLAANCTFSVAGRHRAGVGLMRLERKQEFGPANKCRLSHCYARGNSLVALDLDAPGASVLFEGSLIVGNEQPLIQAVSRSEDAVTVRSVRSTFVAGAKFMELNSDQQSQPDLPFRWLSWDTLVARSNEHSGGVLLSLPPGVAVSRLQWQAVNCLYAGWKTLLAGRNTIPASNFSAWQRSWNNSSGDKATPNTWPAVMHYEVAETQPGAYRPAADAGVGYAATSGAGALGCDVAALPACRDNWLMQSHDRFAAPPFDMLTEDAAPEISEEDDGRYHGGAVDLTQTDLGAFLREVQKTTPFAPKVVLHLYGRGECKSSPIHVKGVQLVLYFAPSEDNAKATAILVPDGNRTPQARGFIEVEGGSLDVIGGEIRFPNYRIALVSPYIISVRGANLRMHHCRLQGPLSQAPKVFRGLICLEGSGLSKPEKAHVCGLNEAVLISGKSAIDAIGAGGRLRCRNCVVVAGDDAFHFEPGAGAPARLNIQCFIEHGTIAAQRAAIHVEDVPNRPAFTEPLVVQTRLTAFLNPFAGAKSPAALVLFEGQSLPRGLLVWRGEENIYDKRLHLYAGLAPLAEAIPTACQPYTDWVRICGGPAEHQPTLDLPFKRTFDLDHLRFEDLALPISPRSRKPSFSGEEKKQAPGADLKRLGVLKTAMKSSRS